ncbi:MAG: hemolysin family protein, partial [Kiritimatiellales bacterium]|nr:hemolysin family protein [Kiritimatiellales bacterium]
MPSFFQAIDSHYLSSSLAALASAFFFSTLFTSLRSTGDAGLPRLIQRAGRQTKRLRFWQKRWNLLCKTARFFLTIGALATFILFYLALHRCQTWHLVGGLFLLALLYMLVVRIVPHVFAESYADRISLAALPLIGPLTLLMFVFVKPLQWVEDKLLHHALSASDEDDRPSPEDEIKTLIEETGQEELEEEERNIIRSVFEFGDTVTREIMTPRINISGLKDTLNTGECIQEVKESPHSRFPVYHESIDDVIGIVHVKDLLRISAGGQNETPIRQLVKKIRFVPETMPINDLMQLMKNTQSQLVLVVDEYGGTAGLVSMEDIIEELVGEIEDEYDPQEEEVQKRPDGSL